MDIFLNKRVTELIYDKDEQGLPSVLKGFKTAAGKREIQTIIDAHSNPQI